MTSTTEVLRPLAAATGGDARRLADAGGVNVPRIVAMRSSDTFRGDDWIGLKMREASVVRGIGVLPMFAGLLGPAAAGRRAGRDLGARGPLTRLARPLAFGAMIRPDRSRHAVEGAFDHLRHQQPLPDRPAPASSPCLWEFS